VTQALTMHTAICTFEDRTLAEQAVDRLVQAGFPRHDVHLEQRHPDGSRMEERRDHDVVGKFSFFERLFGAGRHAPQAQAYASALERGLYVVMVEHQDEDEASRAQSVLHGMEARDLRLFDRVGQQKLRDVVSARREVERELERPVASQGWGEQRKLEIVDSDRPIASPDLPAAHEPDDGKPR